MAYTIQSISKYAYSCTLTNNDYAAKLSLWKLGENNSDSKIADINFVYDGQILPANNFQADLKYAKVFMPEKALARIIDQLRNEKPLSLIINPPFAFLSTDTLEPIGDGELK
jgi:hypothetical protein